MILIISDSFSLHFRNKFFYIIFETSSQDNCKNYMVEVYSQQFQEPLLADSTFKIVIRNIQLNHQNNLMAKKNQIRIKKHLRELWLCKSRIIPPTFKRFCKQNYSEYENHISLHASAEKYLNEFRQDEVQRIQTQGVKIRKCRRSMDYGQTDNQNDIQSHANGQSIDVMREGAGYSIRNIASCDRKNRKSNWKLEFRKDELNVLKYSKMSSLDITSDQKSNFNQPATRLHKIQRLGKKFSDFKKAQIQPIKYPLETQPNKMVSPLVKQKCQSQFIMRKKQRKNTSLGKIKVSLN